MTLFSDPRDDEAEARERERAEARSRVASIARWESEAYRRVRLYAYENPSIVPAGLSDLTGPEPAVGARSGVVRRLVADGVLVPSREGWESMIYRPGVPVRGHVAVVDGTPYLDPDHCEECRSACRNRAEFARAIAAWESAAG